MTLASLSSVEWHTVVSFHNCLALDGVVKYLLITLRDWFIFGSSASAISVFLGDIAELSTSVVRLVGAGFVCQPFLRLLIALHVLLEPPAACHHPFVTFVRTEMQSPCSFLCAVLPRPHASSACAFSFYACVFRLSLGCVSLCVFVLSVSLSAASSLCLFCLLILVLPPFGFFSRSGFFLSFASVLPLS